MNIYYLGFIPVIVFVASIFASIVTYQDIYSSPRKWRRIFIQSLIVEIVFLFTVSSLFWAITGLMGGIR